MGNCYAKQGAVCFCAVARWCNGGIVCGRRLLREDSQNEYVVMLKDIRTDLLEKTWLEVCTQIVHIHFEDVSLLVKENVN